MLSRWILGMQHCWQAWFFRLQWNCCDTTARWHHLSPDAQADAWSDFNASSHCNADATTNSRSNSNDAQADAWTDFNVPSHCYADATTNSKAYSKANASSYQD